LIVRTALRRTKPPITSSTIAPAPPTSSKNWPIPSHASIASPWCGSGAGIPATPTMSAMPPPSIAAANTSFTTTST
jgi:hypothetical protein